MLQYSKINALPRADGWRASNVNTFRLALTSPAIGLEVCGPGSQTWGESHRHRAPLPLSRQFLNLVTFWREEEKAKTDLVIPRVVTEVDGITLWVANKFVPFWHSVRSAMGRKMPPKSLPKTEPKKKATFVDAREVQPTLVSYSESYLGPMIRITSFVATVTACLLPTVAIVVLSSVHTLAKLLGFIALFTALFSMGLILLTNHETSSQQIFTATVA